MMSVYQKHLVPSHVKNLRALQAISPVHISGDRMDGVFPLRPQYSVQIALNVSRVDQHVNRRLLPDRLAQKIMSSVGIAHYQNLHMLSPILFVMPVLLSSSIR